MKIYPVDYLIETLARRNGPEQGQRILMLYLFDRICLSNIEKDELSICLRIVKHKVAEYEK